jgi:hypothetical protein
MNNFTKKASKFKKKRQKYTKREYKELYIFDNILKVSFLFENNYRIYNKIDERITNIINKKEFIELYIHTLGNIYKKIFGAIG